ncbi:hypothetical protein VPNG_02094 [Cytospora leucostoma]|uniref:Uncharacterized protein n=1 Tax=Cytospora leucostoma TaxID=1230097 RepID=A0A423XHS9_9PEZI|nr:hypothetical protein VPNG_02094 [Cytospora leucostoma]
MSDTMHPSRDLRGERIEEAVALLGQTSSQIDILLRCEPPMILDNFFSLMPNLATVREKEAWQASSVDNLNKQDALSQYDLATRGWRYLPEMLNAELGMPQCSINFPRWLDPDESTGYDALPGAYLAERQ